MANSFFHSPLSFIHPFVFTERNFNVELCLSMVYLFLIGQELTIQKQPNTSLKDSGPPSNSGGQTPQSSSNQKSPAGYVFIVAYRKGRS